MPDSTENRGRPVEKNPSIYYVLISTAGILGNPQTCLYFRQPGVLVPRVLVLEQLH